MVWLVNGLFCKVLDFVPRHQLIVCVILGNRYGGIVTKIIGILEILMTVWVISGIKRRWCTLVQIALVATMNILEFFLVPDLLLFGHFNLLVALLFIGVLIYTEFGTGDNNSG